MFNGIPIGCVGKKAFSSFREAKKRASKMRAEYERHIQPYRCQLCQRYHVGGNDDGRAIVTDYKRRKRELASE